MITYCLFFFKQKTAYEMRISDWSSDVCSSDLQRGARLFGQPMKGDGPEMRFERKGEIRRLKIIDRDQPPDLGRHHLHLFPTADMLDHAVGMDDVEAVVGIFEIGRADV